MMGTRQKLRGGCEWDVVTDWRKYCCYLKKPGVASSIKRQMRRRRRRERVDADEC